MVFQSSPQTHHYLALASPLPRPHVRQARQDYTYVLRYYPGDAQAAQGLADISQAVEPYPMSIPDR